MRPIPFALVAPAVVLIFGAAVTLASTFLGLRELKIHARDSAQFEADVLADAVGARLSSEPEEHYEDLVRAAALHSGSTLLVLSPELTVIHAAPRQPLAESTLSQLGAGAGPVSDGETSYLFARRSLSARGVQLVVLSPPPDIEEREAAYISSMIMFSALLLFAAGFVGWALARDVHSDVLYVRDLIVAMARRGSSQNEQSIPVRTIDQVGQLTASFNTLLARFQAAERAYRQDLSEARDFDQDRAAFLSALSHELRTPLNAILGFADVLLDEIDGPLSEESRENLTIVRTSGEHLRSLIDDILALSALESGEFRLSREQLDILSVARDVVVEGRVTAQQKGLTVELEGPREGEADTVAYADRRRMRQVLGNVISNAIKFTTRGGVKVRVYRELDDIVAKVSDTGPGIAKEQLEAIFEEFRQAEPASAGRVGTGLGLSITRRLVQMHGGTVRAESVRGQGSVFTIRIPVDEPTISQIPPAVSGVKDPIIRDA